MIQQIRNKFFIIFFLCYCALSAQVDSTSQRFQAYDTIGFSSPMMNPLMDKRILDPDNTDFVPSLMDTINNVLILDEAILGMHCVPLHGEVISRYGMRRGRMHTGTDIRLKTGDTVYAAFDGTVTRSSYYYGYGNMVVLHHGEGLETCYAHLSKLLVKPNDKVMSGDPIGLGGRTGRATTAHLHFELKVNGKFYNPELVFDFEGPGMASMHLDMGPTSGGYKKHTPASGDHHIVAKGDNLYDISRRYGTTVAELCRLNNINKSQILRIGMQLKVR